MRNPLLDKREPCQEGKCYELRTIRGVAMHTERVRCAYCGVHTRMAGWSAQMDDHACAACLWQRWRGV